MTPRFGAESSRAQFGRSTSGLTTMALPATLSNYLQSAGVQFTVVTHTATPRIQQAAAYAGLAIDQVARGVLLQVSGRPVLAVLPAGRLIDFPRLEELLGGTVEIAPASVGQKTFADCEPGTTPVLGEAYGVAMVVDQSVFELPFVHVAAGRAECLLGLSQEAFVQLTERGEVGLFAAEPTPRDAAESMPLGASCPYAPKPEALSKLGCLYTLPAMPQVAMQILRLRDDPNATPQDLAEVVGRDPSLAAQVMRYARSPFFGYRGEINTIVAAIHRVLGFEMVVNMAVGLAAGKAFRNPQGGPLGLEAFWRHATYTACMAQELARRMPPRERPKLGLVYLSALLHNFGFLLLGHLFKPEFAMLNRLAAAHPEAPVTLLERQVLAMGEAKVLVGTGHARLGAWLLHTWDLPEEVVVTVAHHHQEDYDGDHAAYVLLVLLADRLARRIGLGDGDSEDVPAAVLEKLALSQEDCQAVFERVLDAHDGLDDIARVLAA